MLDPQIDKSDNDVLSSPTASTPKSLPSVEMQIETATTHGFPLGWKLYDRSSTNRGHYSAISPCGTKTFQSKGTAFAYIQAQAEKKAPKCSSSSSSSNSSSSSSSNNVNNSNSKSKRGEKRLKEHSENLNHVLDSVPPLLPVTSPAVIDTIGNNLNDLYVKVVTAVRAQHRGELSRLRERVERAYMAGVVDALGLQAGNFDKELRRVVEESVHDSLRGDHFQQAKQQQQRQLQKQQQQQQQQQGGGGGSYGNLQLQMQQQLLCQAVAPPPSPSPPAATTDWRSLPSSPPQRSLNLAKITTLLNNKCPPGKNVEVEGMAKRLEECLWGEANTLEAYMNDETLERRMLTVSKMILERSSSTVNKNSTV
ncbi:hypothetical protein ScalyP_jg8514 [Parmales sp. scaly parma]|nr:hypothetical protein ScalyP_jg8514 [Parmales sp. scaly parma]